MDKIALARKALGRIGETTFPCVFYHNSWGDWRDSGPMVLSAEELLFLVKKENQHGEVFEGLAVKEIDPYERISQLSEEAAERTDPEADENWWNCHGESLSMWMFIGAWDSIVDLIMEGKVTEENLDAWLAYFDQARYVDAELFEMWASDNNL